MILEVEQHHRLVYVVASVRNVATLLTNTAW